MTAQTKTFLVSLCAASLVCISCDRTLKTASQAELRDRWFGAGKINACSYLTRNDAKEYFGKDAKLVFHPFFNECFLVAADTPESDTYRPSPSHPFIALRSYTREQWEKDKDPNPSSDRAVEGLGDEAIDQGGPDGIFFRKGDHCFAIYGYSHTDRTLKELTLRIVSRL